MIVDSLYNPLYNLPRQLSDCFAASLKEESCD